MGHITISLWDLVTGGAAGAVATLAATGRYRIAMAAALGAVTVVLLNFARGYL